MYVVNVHIDFDWVFDDVIVKDDIELAIYIVQIRQI